MLDISGTLYKNINFEDSFRPLLHFLFLLTYICSSDFETKKKAWIIEYDGIVCLSKDANVSVSKRGVHRAPVYD